MSNKSEKNIWKLISDYEQEKRKNDLGDLEYYADKMSPPMSQRPYRPAAGDEKPESYKAGEAHSRLKNKLFWGGK
jgi:hypothetical protein